MAMYIQKNEYLQVSYLLLFINFEVLKKQTLYDVTVSILQIINNEFEGYIIIEASRPKPSNQTQNHKSIGLLYPNFIEIPWYGILSNRCKSIEDILSH